MTALVAVAAAVALVAGGTSVRAASGCARRRALRRRLAAPVGVDAAPVGPRRRLLAAPAWARVRLDDAGVVADADEAWTAWVVVAGVAAAGSMVVGGIGLASTVVFLVVGGPLLALWIQRGRADRLLVAALPGVLEAVAGSLRSGATLHRALEEAAEVSTGRVGGDLRAVVDDVRGGTPLIGALERWVEVRPVADVRLAVAAMALGVETGGAQARAVDGVAATMRDRLAVLAEVRALSSQARLSGLVIALAPVGFGLLAAATDPRTATFLFRTPFGMACLVAGLALDAVAAIWMHRLTESW